MAVGAVAEVEEVVVGEVAEVEEVVVVVGMVGLGWGNGAGGVGVPWKGRKNVGEGARNRESGDGEVLGSGTAGSGERMLENLKR